jgi:hypothetical protein
MVVKLSITFRFAFDANKKVFANQRERGNFWQRRCAIVKQAISGEQIDLF